MTEAQKEAVVRAVYHNKVYGFGSVVDTTKHAKLKDPSITQAFVKSVLDTIKHRQTHYTPNKHNTFISMYPKYEYQVDIADFTAKAAENGGYRYALIAVDGFSKYAAAIPIKTRSPDDVTTALKEIFKKIGDPEQIYTDQEGAFTSAAFTRVINSHRVKHITTVGKANGAERLIQTIKHNIYRRLDALEEPVEKWIDHIDFVLNKYNNTQHQTTGLTPNQGRNPRNEMFVRYNLFNKAKTERKYPELKPNDSVRIMLVKDGKTKGYHPKFSSDVYKVLHVSGNGYLVSNNRKKVYLRHELLKVP